MADDTSSDRVPAHEARELRPPRTAASGHLSAAGAEHLSLLHRVSSIAVSSLDGVRIAQQAVEAMAESFDTSFITLRLANRERSRLRIVAMHGLPDEYIALAGVLPADAEHLSCEVFSTGEPVYGDPLAAHRLGAALTHDLAPFGVHPQALLVFPLKGRSSTVGTVTLGWPAQRRFSAEDIASFTSFANVLAAGIENAYLYEDERRTAEVARRVSTATQRLATEFSSIFDSLGDAVIVFDHSGTVTRANPAALHLFGFDPAGEVFSSIAERAGMRDTEGRPMRAPAYPCRHALSGVPHEAALTLEKPDGTVRVLVSAAPIVSDGVVTAAVSVWRDVSERESLIETLAAERQRVEGILATITDGFAFIDRQGLFRSANPSFAAMFGVVPDDIVGTHHSTVFDEERSPDILHALRAAFAEESPSALVQHYQPTDRWTETRIYPGAGGVTMFVNDVSNRRNAEIERERLLVAYRMELARTSLLKDIAATAGSSLSVAQVCRLVIDTVRSHLDPAQGMVHLYDESTDSLVLASHFGLPAAVVSAVSRLPADESWAAGRLVAGGAPQVTHDTPGLRWPDDERADASGWMIVPVVSAGRPLATLGLVFDERRAFSADEVSLFRSIADQLASALDNARLYQKEHRIADTLQRSLLAESTRVRGLEMGRVYRSATEHVRVGGDFYDVYPLPDGRAGITIGDVSGKGLQAATVTALVRNTLRAHALDGLEPHEVVSKTNAVLCYFSDREVFATAAFGILDPADGTFGYCNGGHPAPVIARHDGTVAVLSSSNPMLGAMEGLPYETSYARLERGDTLVLYTDGVVEARSGDAFFGEDRLIELVRSLAGAPVEMVARAVAEAAWQFGGGVLRDDVAVVALKRSG